MIATEAWAQEWLRGTIVMTNGDTLSGEISVRAMQKNACIFRNHDQPEMEYTPEQVKEFFVNGGNHFRTLRLSDESRFANVLVRGQAELLRYRARFFLVDTVGDIFELERIISRKEEDGRQVELIRDKFKQTLTWKFAGCDKASLHMASTTLTEPALIRIFNEYNSCFSSAAPVVAPRRKHHLYVGVDYGYLKTQLGDFSASFNATMDKRSFRRYDQAFEGVFAQFTPGHFKAISVDLAIHRLNFSFNSVREFPEQGYILTYNSSYSVVRVPLGISYSLFSWRRVQPFVRLATAVHFNKSPQQGYRLFTYTSTGEGDIELVNTIHNPVFSVISDLGVNFKVGPLLFGARMTFEYMGSPLSTTSLIIPYSMHSTQFNFGVAGSAAYAFRW